MFLQLKRQKLVKKVEVKPDQVIIYLEQVRWGMGTRAGPCVLGCGDVPHHG